MKLRVRFAGQGNCPEAGQDLWCLERDHATEGNTLVPDLLEAADRRRIRSRTPPLCHAERFEPDLPCPGPSQEDTGVFEGELLARLPLLELRMTRVGVGG